ncbi:MAG: InlB B-repeat-containing protein [Clostridia bacterium]|nr:InlB B-repeat-containing protein [Clostridia bacterium]
MKHRFEKRILSLVLCLSMVFTLIITHANFAFSAEQKDVVDPFVSPFRPDVPIEIDGKTAYSQSYRIPNMVTLNDGTIVAAADIRWNTTYDGGGLDTLVARSKDGGATWEYTLANYLGDNGNEYNYNSTAFIDSSLVLDNDGKTLYMLVDLYAYGVALNGLWKDNTTSFFAYPSSDDGFDDNGRLKLAKKGYSSFDYYLDGDKIYNASTNVAVDGYVVDGHFNVTYTENGQTVTTNLFYQNSPFNVVRTPYLYFIKSTDGGETWSDPTLLNLREKYTRANSAENALLVSPGNAIMTKNGTMVYPVYSYSHYGVSSSYQKLGLIYSADDGKTWERTSNYDGLTFSSEGSVVELQNGKLRVFFRNETARLCYVDYNLETKAWDTHVQTTIPVNSNTQLSALSYNGTVDGKQIILVSCPTGPNSNGSSSGDGSYRTNGKILVFVVDDEKTMSLKKTIDVNEYVAVNQLSGSNYLESDAFFAYSAITVRKDGSIALLYENNQYGWGFGDGKYYTITGKAFDPSEFGFELDEIVVEENCVIVDSNGNEITSVTMNQYEKPEITADTTLSRFSSDIDYQWQIEYEDGKWVDIYGEDEKTIKISYGMVANLLDDDGKVDIRCKSFNDGKVAYSKPITVTLEMYEPKEPDVVVSESFVTSNGETVTVSIAGDIPEDASVALEETDSEGITVDEGEVFVAALDISIKNADGTEWQPESGESVTVNLPASSIGLMEGDNFVVYHLHNGEVRILGTYTVTDGTVSFEVDGFSKFVFALASDAINFDYSADIGKHAHLTWSDEVMFEVLDFEPDADFTTLTFAYDVTDFSTDFVIKITDYKVVTQLATTTIQVAEDSVGDPSDTVETRRIYSLWYQFDIVKGDYPEELFNGMWVLQNYLSEEDAYAVDTLTLFDAPDEPIVPDEPVEPVEPSVGITVNGETVDEVTVSKSDKVTVTATPNVEGSMTYKWQLLIPAANMWVNISGQTSADCTINYGMVSNRLDSNGQAHIRCVTTINGVEVISEPIAVNLVTTYSLFNNYWMPVSKTLSSPNSRAGEGDTTLYNVVINYVFENGEVAANPFTSKIGVTGELTTPVEFPVVQGYLPYVNDVRQDSYTFDLYGNQMTEDFVMNVVYKPTLVDYTIVVMLQNVHNDNYTESEEHRTTLQALTGTVISSDTEVDVDIPGFYQLLHKQATVAADGSTVIEVRFDRFYYLMTFELGDGGYGVLPVYARYGTEVEVGTPDRPGYSFSHWANELGESITFPQSMPAEDVTFTAVWNSSDAKYTVVYWKENADDNGYSYWGSVIKESTSGAVVNGSDDIPTTITYATVDGSRVDEKIYFTYNDTLTDKNVVVKGDGSTVVNVYYKRNYYTIYFRGYGKCCLDEHTHGTNCNSKLICTLEEHTHGQECNRTLNCDIPVHSAHDADCLKCGKTEHTSHTDACLQCAHSSHTLDCYDVGSRVLRETTKPNNSSIPSNPVNGTVYTYKNGNGANSTYYVLYLDGKWYSAYKTNGDARPYQEIKLDCSHTHNASCYRDELHTHIESCYKDVVHEHNDSCYKYSCGKVVHKHDADDCYSECTKTAHTHGNNCNSNNTNNVIYVITAKYQQDISALWPTYDKLAASDSKHYKNGSGQPVNSNGSRFRGWDVDNASAEAVSKRINMTRDLCDTDQGYQYADAQYSASYSYKLYYMFESFDQTTAANGTTRKAYTVNGTRVYFDSDPAYYQELMYSSDTTFNQKQVLGMNPVGTEKSTSNSIISNWLYYTRNRSAISYQNIDTVIDTKSNVMFGESLKAYKYSGTPPYPSSLEAGAYQFAGWYTTAGCFDGTEVDFENGTMPNGNVTFYAKWEPVTHTVEFYKQKDDSGNLIEKIGDTYSVKHNQKLNEQYIPQAPEDFENGAYSFAGWWYMDGTTERRYDFKSLPVTEDLVVYAKWTSNKQIQYIVNFELSDGTKVADSISSSDLAGTTVTFDAKGANELYPKYREGYFPNVKSHSITLDINDADGVMEYTFVYTPVNSVPYTVYYLAETLKEGGTSLGTHVLDGKTYYIIAATKTVSNNKLAYVSENFVPVAGYVPDDFQKNLVITPGADNTIVFYYKVDTKNAPYKVTHYFQNLDGNGWTVEKTYSGIAAIDSIYTENPMTGLVGFTYDPTIEGSKASGVVTADGLELKLYYVRNKYPYKVIYKDRISGEELYTTTLPVEMYGKVVSATAPNAFGNRTLVSDATQTLTIRVDDIDNPTNNIITFFYEETNVNLNYVIVAPDGTEYSANQTWGTLTSFGESVKVSTGTANGSTASVVSNVYKFVGWYSDKDCQNPVPAEWVDASGKITPQKPGELWVNATYYAKFEYNLTSLKIDKAFPSGADYSMDANQSFLFDVVETDSRGNVIVGGTKLTVTIHGDGDVTIDGLTVGSYYKITEKTDWSWRYNECVPSSDLGVKNVGDKYIIVQLTADKVANVVKFTNTRSEEKWLDGDSWCNNLFK